MNFEITTTAELARFIFSDEEMEAAKKRREAEQKKSNATTKEG